MARPNIQSAAAEFNLGQEHVDQTLSSNLPPKQLDPRVVNKEDNTDKISSPNTNAPSVQNVTPLQHESSETATLQIIPPTDLKENATVPSGHNGTPLQHESSVTTTPRTRPPVLHPSMFLPQVIHQMMPPNRPHLDSKKLPGTVPSMDQTEYAGARDKIPHNLPQFPNQAGHIQRPQIYPLDMYPGQRLPPHRPLTNIPVEPTDVYIIVIDDDSSSSSEEEKLKNLGRDVLEVEIYP